MILVAFSDLKVKLYFTDEIFHDYFRSDIIS